MVQMLGFFIQLRRKQTFFFSYIVNALVPLLYQYPTLNLNGSILHNYCKILYYHLIRFSFYQPELKDSFHELGIRVSVISPRVLRVADAKVENILLTKTRR